MATSKELLAAIEAVHGRVNHVVETVTLIRIDQGKMKVQFDQVGKDVNGHLKNHAETRKGFLKQFISIVSATASGIIVAFFLYRLGVI